MQIDIEYKDGTMILTHPSGHVDIHTEKDIENRIEQITDRVTELNMQLFDMKSIKAELLASE